MSKIAAGHMWLKSKFYKIMNIPLSEHNFALKLQGFQMLKRWCGNVYSTFEC